MNAQTSKTVNTIGNVLQIGAGLMLASSFFVKDNDKAVNRRWAAVGVFALGWGMNISTVILANPKLIKGK